MRFEPNHGQQPAEVLFTGRSSNAQVHVLADRLLIAMPGGSSFELLVGKATAVTPEQLLPGVVHHMTGQDASAWLRDLPTYERIRMHGVAPGIDVVVYGTAEGRLEFDHVLSPGARAADAAFRVQGHDAVELAGDLTVRVGDESMVLAAPIAYQEIPLGRTSVAAAFRLDGDQVSYNVGAYDATRTLIIDPVLRYGSHLGSTSWEYGNDLTVHDPGTPDVRHVYVVGQTYNSAAFPPSLSGTSRWGATGSYDGFISKFEYNLRTHTMISLWFMYVGGTSTESLKSVQADSAGNIYVAGRTDSTNWPTLNHVKLDVGGSTIYEGNARVASTEAVFAKFSPAGVPLFSTYMGASNIDYGLDAAPDGSGGIVVVGESRMTAISVTPYKWPTTPGALQPAHRMPEGYNGYVARINIQSPTSTFVFSTFLSGSLSSSVQAVAVDATGIYVTGTSSFASSSDFPTTPGAFMTTASTSSTTDSTGFVTKYNLVGSAYLYSTLLNGDSTDLGYDVVVDPAGRAWVAGWTGSTNYPTCATFSCAAPGGPPLMATRPGSYSGTITGISADGSRLIYGTYYGGSGFDTRTTHISYEPVSGHVAVTGWTPATDIPRASALYPTLAGTMGRNDAFYGRLDPASGTLIHGSYIGGGESDTGAGIFIDRHWNIFLAGYTSLSSAFPFPTKNPIQATHAGIQDAFLAVQGKLGPTAKLTGDGGTFGTVTAPPASPALSVALGTGITYTASASTAGDFPINWALAQWELKEGATVLATGTGGMTPTFPGYTMPLSFSSIGTRTVCVTVWDNDPFGLYDRTDKACVDVNWGSSPPTADFSVSAIVPAGAAIPFTDLSTDADGIIVGWDWDFGDGGTSTLANPTHAFSAGIYTIRLKVTDDDGLTGTKTFLIDVRDGPIAVFAPASGPYFAGIPLTINEASLPGSAAITGWSWDFGDATTGSATGSFTHTYASPGLYTARLTVTDGMFTSSTTRTLEVLDPQPFARPDSYTIVQESVLSKPDGTLTANDIDIVGSGLTAALAAPATFGTATVTPGGGFTYTPPVGFVGTDSFTYTVTSAGLTSTPVAVTITVSPFLPPVAAFLPEVRGITGVFTDLSTLGDHPIVSWAWDFGDGTTSSDSSPVHIYSVAGFHDVELRIADAYGLTSMATHRIYVPPVAVQPAGGPDAPKADAGPDRRHVAGDTIVLRGSANIDDKFLHYRWTQIEGPAVTFIGDRQTLSFVAPPGPASLAFALMVHDGDRPSPADIVRIIIDARNEPPQALSATRVLTVAIGEGVELDGTPSYDPDQDPLTYRWMQVSGPKVEIEGADSATARFTASAPGKVVLHLRVADGTDSDVFAVEIDVKEAGPRARFDIAAVDGNTFAFKPTGTYAVVWDFGDGSAVSHLREPVHTYASPGSYRVRLSVSDAGSSDVIERIVHVQGHAAAAPAAPQIPLEPAAPRVDPLGPPTASTPGVGLLVLLGLLGLIVARRRR
jgi:PKD repeat protein